MRKTLTLLVASTALTAAIGMPAWSAMHAPADESRSARRGALRGRGRRRCPSSWPATMTTTITADTCRTRGVVTTTMMMTTTMRR